MSTSKPKKLRPLGDITSDLEPLLLEMLYDHDMQWGEVIGLIYFYMQVHAPSQQEVYTSDGSSPILTYAQKRSR